MNTNGKAYIENIEVELVAIADCSVGKQGSETIADSINKPCRSANVQESFLLAGKAGIRQVFGSSR